MESIKKMLLENKAWANDKVDNDPDYFIKMAEVQHPEYLWIGCSDSRVHPAELTNTAPGKMFVHRNIANLVVENDTNLLSVIEYAVCVLRIKHIIVCGHYNCGGIHAFLNNGASGSVAQWIEHLRPTFQDNLVDLNLKMNPRDKVNKLVELNVEQQIKNLQKLSFIQNSWQQDKKPILHGWVYNLYDGLIKTILTVSP